MAHLKGHEARLDIPVSVSEIPIMSDIPTNDVSGQKSFTAMWQRRVCRCVLAQCAEMCLYGNVAKTHLPVLLESTVG